MQAVVRLRRRGAADGGQRGFDRCPGGLLDGHQAPAARRVAWFTIPRNEAVPGGCNLSHLPQTRRRGGLHDRGRYAFDCVRAHRWPQRLRHLLMYLAVEAGGAGRTQRWSAAVDAKQGLLAIRGAFPQFDHAMVMVDALDVVAPDFAPVVGTGMAPAASVPVGEAVARSEEARLSVGDLAVRETVAAIECMQEARRGSRLQEQVLTAWYSAKLGEGPLPLAVSVVGRIVGSARTSLAACRSGFSMVASRSAR